MNRHRQHFRPLIGSALLVVTVAFALLSLMSSGVSRASAAGGFAFHEHLVAKGSESNADAWVVTPDSPDARLPVIVFLHGSGGSLRGDGGTLRMMASAGFSAVGMEYSQRNAEEFHRQFAELLIWIREQPWAEDQPIVWLGFSLGAQRMLQHLMQYPESKPALFIRVAGGMVSELRDVAAADLASKLPVWLVHGENDRLFKLDDVREVKSRLEGMGASVRLDVLPGRSHAFKEDRAMVIKLLIDRVARHFETLTVDDADFAEERE
jgi:dienelactone hydrolase